MAFDQAPLGDGLPLFGGDRSRSAMAALLVKVMLWGSILLWSSIGVANPCSWLLAEDTSEARAVEHVLGFILGDGVARDNPVLHRNLVLLMAHDLRGQSSATRDAVLSTIATALFAEPGEALSHHPATLAQIEYVDGRLGLRFADSIADSFVLLIFIAHEFIHLLHDFEYEYASPGVIRLKQNPVGRLYTYLSERRALGREYDLMRASFSEEDAVRLKARHARAFARVRKCKAARRGDPDARAERERLRANLSVARDVLRTQTTSRADFVRRELGHYRVRHAELQAIEFLSMFDHAPPNCEAEEDARIALFTRVNVEIQRARAAAKRNH